MRFRPVSALGTLALSLLVAGAAFAGGPQERPRSGSVSKQVTRTGPNGAQRTWTQERSFERGDGRYQSHTTRTGPGGRSRSKDVAAERTESGYERHTTFTDARGRETHRDAEVTLDREAGSRQKDVVWTGAEGNTLTRSSERVRTEDGYTRTTTLTGPDGKSATWEKTVSRETSQGD